MSHFATVSKAQIVSAEAFIAACGELGYKEITRNGTIRGWQGQTTNVDVAVRVPDYRYDFGIRKVGGRFELVAESMFDRNRLNKVVQMTTKHTLISTYRKQGFVARVHQDEKQNLVVTLTR